MEMPKEPPIMQTYFFPCRYHKIFPILVLLLFQAAIAHAAATALGDAEHPVRMTFVPSGDTQVILESGGEIARMLREITGLHFEASIATSYAASVEALGAAKVEVGWLPAFSYVLARDKYEVEILLMVSRFGSPFSRGQIVVNAKNRARGLEDLRGKTFAFVDAASASGHVFPKALLLSRGFDPETFFSKSLFAGSHNAVILSVMRGEVDAGATYDDARATVAREFPDVFDKVKVIAYTKDIPNDAICVRKGVDAALKEKIRDGLKKLSASPRGGELLKKVYGIGGLIDFDGLYDPVRKARQLLHLNEKDIK
jgi:phosphonate transport system substrate-binding protein